MNSTSGPLLIFLPHPPTPSPSFASLKLHESEGKKEGKKKIINILSPSPLGEVLG